MNHHPCLEFLKVRTWKSTPASFRNIYISVCICHYSTSPLPGENKGTTTAIHCYIALITILFMFFDIFFADQRFFTLLLGCLRCRKGPCCGRLGSSPGPRHHCRVHHPQPCNRWINLIYIYLCFFEGAKNTNLHIPLLHHVRGFSPKHHPPTKDGELWFASEDSSSLPFFSFFCHIDWTHKVFLKVSFGGFPNRNWLGGVSYWD